MAILLCACGSAAQTNETGELFLRAIEQIDTSQLRSFGRHEFSVRWDQITKKTSWKPGLEAFPMDIGDAAKRAASSICGLGICTSRVALAGFAIRRINVPQEALPKALTHEERTNLWDASFWFDHFEIDNQTGHQAHHVVMLLDGTVASDRLTLGKRTLTSIAATEPSQFPPVSKTDADIALLHSNQPAKTPFGDLISPDFQIPGTQWDALASEFPLDLNQELLHAIESDSKGISNSGDLAKLVEISVEKFFPAGRIQAKGLEPQLHLNHWLVIFRFRQDIARIRDYKIYMLLDGRLLSRTASSGIRDTKAKQ